MTARNRLLYRLLRQWRHGRISNARGQNHNYRQHRFVHWLFGPIVTLWAAHGLAERYGGAKDSSKKDYFSRLPVTNPAIFPIV